MSLVVKTRLGDVASGCFSAMTSSSWDIPTIKVRSMSATSPTASVIVRGVLEPFVSHFDFVSARHEPDRSKAASRINRERECLTCRRTADHHRGVRDDAALFVIDGAGKLRGCGLRAGRIDRRDADATDEHTRRETHATTPRGGFQKRHYSVRRGGGGKNDGNESPRELQEFSKNSESGWITREAERSPLAVCR